MQWCGQGPSSAKIGAGHELQAQRVITEEVLLIPQVQAVKQMPEHPFLCVGGVLSMGITQSACQWERAASSSLPAADRESACQKMANRLGQRDGVLGYVIMTGHRLLLLVVLPDAWHTSGSRV
jgi:hypothetical protein